MYNYINTTTTTTMKCNKNQPILVAVVFGITRNSAKLFPITTQHLGIESVFAATAVTQ